MPTYSNDALFERLQNVETIPSLPVVVAPLMRYLEQPLDQLDLQKTVDLLSQDKSLTAQCLHMANSPLWGHWQRIDSLRGAVVALGFQRLREIVISCSVLKLVPVGNSGINPVVFWEHSFGCALVSRHFARKINFGKPEKAYLAGLLHDLGIIVNLWLFPKEFGAAISQAQEQRVPLHETELAILGLTHCDSGRALAERWALTPDLIDVVQHHHDPTKAADGTQGMEAIVHAGGFTVGQDESSCTVYGMPRACAEARILRRVVPLHQIPAEILEAVAYHSRSKPASAGS